MLVREDEKKITKFTKRNVVDISNPCDTKKTPCKKIVVQFLVIEKNFYNRLKLYL